MRLSKAKLKPVGDRSTFFQPITLFKTFLDTNKCFSTLQTLHSGKDYWPDIRDLGGELKFKTDRFLFVGYGIEDHDFNDYTFVQPRNEVLLMLDGIPKRNGKSVIKNELKEKNWSSSLELKIKTAKSKGAKLIILIQDSASFARQTMRSLTLWSIDNLSDVDIKILRINEASLSKLFVDRES